MIIYTSIIAIFLSSVIYVSPVDIWQDNIIEQQKHYFSPTLPVVTEYIGDTNKYTINRYTELEAVFTTTEDDTIPAYIQVVQRNDKELCIWFAIEFKKDCELSELIIIREYTKPQQAKYITHLGMSKTIINLDAFMKTKHRFRSGEKYGITWWINE